MKSSSTPVTAPDGSLLLDTPSSASGPESVDAWELIRRLERLAADAKGRAAVIFDADGTLWTGDVGSDAFVHAFTEGLLREDARPALLAEVKAHGLGAELELQGTRPEDADANLLAQELQRAFSEGRYPERATSEMQVWAYAGWTEAELREHTRRTLKRREHLSQIHHTLLPVMLWAREARLRAVIVSASPQLVVEEAARDLGFGPDDIVAGRAQAADGVFLPALAGSLPYGPDKVRAGKRLLGNVNWLAAFGDSDFDAEMLSESKLPVLVRPRPALLDRLGQLRRAVLFADAPPHHP